MRPRYWLAARQVTCRCTLSHLLCSSSLCHSCLLPFSFSPRAFSFVRFSSQHHRQLPPRALWLSGYLCFADEWENYKNKYNCDTLRACHDGLQLNSVIIISPAFALLLSYLPFSPQLCWPHFSNYFYTPNVSSLLSLLSSVSFILWYPSSGESSRITHHRYRMIYVNIYGECEFCVVFLFLIVFSQYFIVVYKMIL